VITAAVVAAAMAACGAVSTPGAARDDGGAVKAAPTTSLSHLLPDDVRAARRVTVATDPTYPPFETLSADQKTIEGLDPDLLDAMADKLGIEIVLTKAGFDSLIPGLQAGRYQMAMSGMTDTKERQAKVTFVDYLQVGGAIVLSAADPAREQTMPAALCGKKVGVQTGSITGIMSGKESEKCGASGRPAIKLTNFPSVPAAVLALDSDRVQYVWTDSVSAAAQVKASNGRFAAVSDETPTQPSGMVFPKDSPLIEAFRAALQAVIDDGTYLRILSKYGLQSGAVPSAGVNQGRS
jgi:polar amino acid transport system substrate-binding protein